MRVCLRNYFKTEIYRYIAVYVVSIIEREIMVDRNYSIRVWILIESSVYIYFS